MTRYSITLDLTKYTTQLSVPCKNTDVGREIAITLHQNGVPYTLTADNYAVFVAKSSGADIVNDCVVDLVNNCVVYKITPQTIANGGNIPCEIQLFGYDREQIGSPTFNILVRKSILGETNIESSDEYGTLNAIINDIRRSLEAGEFDGKSAYQYAVEYGYEGSEEEFGTILADLKTYKEFTDQHLFDHDEAIAELKGDNEQLYMIADEIVALNETTAKRVDFCEKRIKNLEKGLPDERFVTDDSVAYVKRIPTNACPFAAVAKVGGKTSKCTNLLPYPYVDSTATVKGVTFTDNGDGTITANGTPNENAVFWLTNNLQLAAGTYRIVLREASESDGILLSIMKNGKWIYDTASSYKIEIADGDIIRLYLQVLKGKTANNKTLMPRVNFGDTVLPYEKYYEGIQSEKVTAIESKDASGNIIGRFDFSTEVQSLKGYGEGAVTASNYIDFESAQFVKKVHTIDLGTLNWEVSASNCFVAYLPTDKIAKPTGSYKIAANAVCSKYDNLAQDTLYANKKGIAIQATSGTTVYVYDATYTEASAFKSAMNGVILCYELATTETTDISDLITVDNLIEVEGGGTLTFVNEHGAAVPSTILYQTKGE